MYRWKKLLALPLFLLTLAATTHSIFAQGIITGTISGTVVDQQGAVVPNAAVSATNTATGASISTTSLGNGTFAFRDTPIGTYSLHITATGFTGLDISNVLVSTGNNTNLGSQVLKIGSTSTVNVNETNTLQIDTTNAQVSTTFTPQQIQDLPLANGFDNLALLSPGVGRTLGDNFSNTNGAGFSSGGQRGRSNNSEIDGQSNNDNSVGGPQIFFGNQDALGEVQTVTDQFGAQYGRNMGSVINYVTKSGTNQFHGSAFEYFTGSWLSSLSGQQKSPSFGYCLPGQSTSTGCLPVVVPRLTDNRYGATLGGPVMRDKLWFFGSGYWERETTGAVPGTSGNSVTPTPAGLQMLAAAFPNSSAVGILNTYGPYGIKAGNPTEVVSQATTEKVTTPSGGTLSIPVAPISRLIPSPYSDDEYMGRLDWQPTSRDRLFGRYFYQHNDASGIGLGGTGLAAGDWYSVPDTAHSVGADLTHTFSPRFVDQLRYSFQQTKILFQGGANPLCTTTSLTVCTSNLSFNGGTTDFGFGEATNLPQGRTVKVTQVQDNATFTSGNNTILFGGEFDYQNSPNVFLPNYNGQYAYSNLSSFLNDTGASVTLGNGNPVLPFTEPDYALYFQDDWKVRPDLTVNLGIRWELFTQAINKLHNESVATQTGPNPFWSKTLPLSQTTLPAVKTPYKNYQPRIGFNWSPEGLNNKLSVQGGFAINFDPVFYNIFLNIGTSAPLVNLATFQPAGANLPPNGAFTGAAVRATQLHNLPTGGNPGYANLQIAPTNFHNPYTESYRLGVQYQLTPLSVLSVGYVGNHQVGLFQAFNANPNLANVAAQFPNIVSPSSLCTTPNVPGTGHVNCAIGNASAVGNTGFGLYNSLQVQYQLRTAKNLQVIANYTYSQTIDNTSEIFSTFGGGNTNAYAQNPQNIDQGERATSGLSFPNIAAVQILYTLPFYESQSNWKNLLFGGYEVSTIFSAQSGQVLNPLQPALFGNPVTGALDSSYCDLGFDFAFIGADNCRMLLSNPKAPKNTVAYYAGTGHGYVEYGTTNPINPANTHWIVNNIAEANLIGNPYAGAGRNTLRGDPFMNVDASMFKTTNLSHGVVLKINATMYNVTNYNYLGAPQPYLGAFSATGINGFLSNAFNGSGGTTLGLLGNRQVQLAGHIEF